MNASARGIMFVKADRIDERINDYTDYFLKLVKNRKSISREDFKDYVKGIHIIIDSELTEKGVERKFESK